MSHSSIMHHIADSSFDPIQRVQLLQPIVLAPNSNLILSISNKTVSDN